MQRRLRDAVSEPSRSLPVAPLVTGAIGRAVRKPQKRIEGEEMFKCLIPALTVAMLGHCVASAQFFGANYPASPGYSQPARPIRIARATDNELLASPSDNLDDLDARDAFDQPPAGDLPALVPAATGGAIDSPQSLELLDSLEPPKLQDIPERLELPLPKQADQSASPSDLNSVQPEISAQDLQALQPPPEPLSILESSPVPATPIPGPIDFNEAIQQQQRDLAHSHHHSSPSQYYGGTYQANHDRTFHASTDYGYSGEAANGCGSGLTPLPYRAPLLPPSNSFHGHFKANPCYFDIWANYPAEVAAACAHNRAKLAPSQKTGCKTCELVDPRPCR